METLKRIREPLAWAMVAIAVLELVLVVARMLWFSGDVVLYESGAGEAITVASYVLSSQTIDYPVLIALALAVWGCAVDPATPRARPLALTAAWLATLIVAAPWIAIAMTLIASPPQSSDAPLQWDWWMLSSLFYPLVYTGVAAVATIALWALAIRPHDDAVDGGEPDEDAAPEAEEPTDEPEDGNPTVWKPAEATGTVWRTADEAASGAPGARYLDPSPDDEPDTEPQAEHDWRPPGA